MTGEETPPPNIDAYLVAMARAGHRISEWLLAHGRRWDTGPRSFEGERGIPQQCFRNASNAALFDRRLTYVEGVVTVFGIPIDHAWCIDEDGLVVDPTLRGDAVTAAQEYFGVPFDREYLADVLLRTRTYGVIEFNQALLSGEDTGWEVSRWRRG